MRVGTHTRAVGLLALLALLALSQLAPARVMNGRVYNESSDTLRAWASGKGYLTVPPHSKTGEVDVDHVEVCGQWYKIRYDGWVRVYDGCRLARLGTQCPTDGPGKPCR